MAESNLHKLSARGQSVWIDSLSRTMLETGELARLMNDDAVVGATSNPTIFQKAMAAGDAYDAQLRELLEQDDGSEGDLLRSRRATSRRPAICSRRCTSGSRSDGFVSLEVDPTLAYDREGTFDEAMRLHK